MVSSRNFIFARDLRAVVMEISKQCRFFTFRSRMSISNYYAVWPGSDSVALRILTTYVWIIDHMLVELAIHNPNFLKRSARRLGVGLVAYPACWVMLSQARMMEGVARRLGLPGQFHVLSSDRVPQASPP